MLEDRLLIWKLKHGNMNALQRIYEKYKDDLLALAVSLSYDRALAEDALHDVFVFVSLTQYVGKLRLRTGLRPYLSRCVANRVRHLSGMKKGRLDRGRQEGSMMPHASHDRDQEPDQRAMAEETYRRIDEAMSALPYAQRECLTLHVQAGMRFKAIATMRGVSINTIQSRYRYGLDKLRSLLKDEAKE